MSDARHIGFNLVALVRIVRVAQTEEAMPAPYSQSAGGRTPTFQPNPTTRRPGRAGKTRAAPSSSNGKRSPPARGFNRRPCTKAMRRRDEFLVTVILLTNNTCTYRSVLSARLLHQRRSSCRVLCRPGDQTTVTTTEASSCLFDLGVVSACADH